ncbi:hypothetical protein CONCODRAFT_2768 [Conidiobolus coronatus NRRL 28638]|uniref:Ricin B lectin domain-containing protein n=1 Tax=Conidiobolus coronatus (strain ATCC 28846 / CBS 209.66 / NRRL 28638) TaxID=796925 RepID=A0A137PGX1_CONC2|nr:hypothetical protein CONCODRAFT_2768 [Conidiobolus coronatus NRRL 28638]|eukprot:KXN74232.1 hypothetical protein CONCODRAFT_2768 [Conidiobolus coronatus NRRL 28638]
MKLFISSLILISSVYCKLNAGSYTITNAQFTGSRISSSSQFRLASHPESQSIDGGSFNGLSNWSIESLGSNQYSLRNAMTNQYLTTQQGNAVGFGETAAPWLIQSLPGELYIIRDTNSGNALTLQGPEHKKPLVLMPATGAVTQNWIFNPAD